MLATFLEKNRRTCLCGKLCCPFFVSHLLNSFDLAFGNKQLHVLFCITFIERAHVIDFEKAAQLFMPPCSLITM